MHKHDCDVTDDDDEDGGKDDRGRTQNARRKNRRKAWRRRHADKKSVDIRRRRWQNVELGQESSDNLEKNIFKGKLHLTQKCPSLA